MSQLVGYRRFPRFRVAEEELWKLVERDEPVSYTEPPTPTWEGNR